MCVRTGSNNLLLTPGKAGGYAICRPQGMKTCGGLSKVK